MEQPWYTRDPWYINGWIETYIVREGATLSGIAETFGVSTWDLVSNNEDLSLGNEELQAGTRLHVPPYGGVE